MPSTALYTSLGQVVEALAFQSPETLLNAAISSATSITLNQSPPSDWQVGSTLVVDGNNPSLRETVTITAPPNGATITVSALTNNHVAGAPVVNGTVANLYVSAASRWFDSQTYVHSGFAYESVTDTKDGYFNPQTGIITVSLTKPLVSLSDVTNATFQGSIWDSVDTLDLSHARIRDDYILEVGASVNYADRRGVASVSYKGGYQTIPDDIQLACTMMAARFYKERDSGYADVVGSAETGIFQYKKAAPADVMAIVETYRRWTE